MLGNFIQLLLITALVLGSIVAVVRKSAAVKRTRRLENRGGCVACGSDQVSVAGDTQTCSTCGYQGRADRGGTLSEREIWSVFVTELDVKHSGGRRE